MFRLPVLEKIFLCIPLRIGNIYLGLISAIFYFVLCIRFIRLHLMCSYYLSDKIFYISMISVLLLHSIFCTKFVVGIIKNHHRSLLPWLVTHFSITLMLVLHFVLHRPFYKCVVILINFILFQTYLWICGYSIYQRTHSQVAQYNILSSAGDSKLSVIFTSIKYQDLRDVLPEITGFEKVLFCLPLRCGNILLGLIGTIFYLAASICLIKEYKRYNSYPNYNNYDVAVPLYFVAMISASIAHSIVCALFVVGILKKKQNMLLPWLLSQILLTIIAAGPHFLLSRPFEFVVFTVSWIIFQTYIWLCGYSIYQTMPTRGSEDSSIPSSECDTFTGNLTSSSTPRSGITGLEKILFWIPLRLGNILLGSFGTLIYLMLSVCFIYQSTIHAYHYSTKLIYITLISATLIHSSLCATFVRGIILKKQRMLLPWLCSQVVMTMATVSVPFMVYRSQNHVTLAIDLIILQAYIWLCGYSIYQRTPLQADEYETVPSTVISETDPLISNIQSSDKYQTIDDVFPELRINCVSK